MFPPISTEKDRAVSLLCHLIVTCYVAYIIYLIHVIKYSYTICSMKPRRSAKKTRLHTNFSPDQSVNPHILMWYVVVLVSIHMDWLYLMTCYLQYICVLYCKWSFGERETYLGICQKLCDGSPKPQQTKKLSTHQLEVTLVSKTTDLGYNHLYVSLLQNCIHKFCKMR